MKIDFAEAIRRATLATRAQDVLGASNIIQDALAGRWETPPEASSPRQDAQAGAPRLSGPAAEPAERPARRRWPLGDAVRVLGGARAKSPFSPGPSVKRQPGPVPEGAQYLTRSFTASGGTRSYRLYVPASASPARGLIVMLHGCKQDPDDFALGTNMNALAETRGLLVAYPAQTRSANASNCWNWFNPADQRRDAGEPSILAGLTRDLVAEFDIDPRCVFVAGLSAGGAMAAVLGATYPELYAAVGVHSGLPYGAAHDAMSAFAAMKGATNHSTHAAPVPAETAGPVRTIVFHGEQDAVVHPVNADRLVAAALAQAEVAPARAEYDGVEGGRRRTTTVFPDPEGVPLVEVWRIEGAGHAWSGGNPAGSFTDPAGPDASAQMVRFFLEAREC